MEWLAKPFHQRWLLSIPIIEVFAGLHQVRQSDPDFFHELGDLNRARASLGASLSHWV